MRAMFLFLRVVAALISLSFVALGALMAVLAAWLGWRLPRSVAELLAVLGLAAFGALMLYVGTRGLHEQSRMFRAWWGSLRCEPTLPPARIVLR